MTGCVLMASNLFASAKPIVEIDIGRTHKPWEWMWGNPPPTDYITSESHACSVAGNIFNNINAAARHIASVQVFSRANVINGLRISHVGGFTGAHGRLDGKASDILQVPADQWISNVKMGCNEGQVSFLSLTTNEGRSIEVGFATKVIEWDNFAAFNILGSANDAGFVSLGVQFSEVKGPHDK